MGRRSSSRPGVALERLPPAGGKLHVKLASALSWLKVAMARLSALLFLPVLIQSAFSISFFLPVNTRKCLREEIHKDVLVTGEYEISEQASTKTNLKVSTEPRTAELRAPRPAEPQHRRIFLLLRLS